MCFLPDNKQFQIEFLELSFPFWSTTEHESKRPGIVGFKKITMRPGNLLVVLVFLIPWRDVQCSTGKTTGSFGDNGLYKVTIEKARFPALPDGISSTESQEGKVKTSVVMHNRKGQPFRCSIPEMVKAPDERDRVVNLTTEAVEQALIPVESNRGCVNLITSGWWNYEFCFGKHVTQYHVDAGGVISKPVITLGVFSHSFNWSNITAKDALKKKDRYHLQYFVNGSKCDITGQLRQTRVKIYCDTSNWAADHIESVREPESCGYEVTIFSRRLCSIPYFRKEEPSVSQIRCNPIGTSSAESGTINPDQAADLSGVATRVLDHDIWTKNQAQPGSAYRESSFQAFSKPNLATGSGTPGMGESDVESFYRRAKEFAAARKEVWVPEDMIYTILTNVLQNTEFHTPNPTNREFIVVELVKRTKVLLETKAKLNSAEQRSLAFDQAAQNVADAKRILKQGDDVSAVFVLHYLPTVGVLQMYVDQFLVMYDLDNTQPASKKEAIPNFHLTNPDVGAAEASSSGPFNRAQISSMLKTIDIVSLKPFSPEEEEMYLAIGEFGKKLLTLSATLKDNGDEESVAAVMDARNTVVRLRDSLNNPLSGTWRPDYREKMNAVLDRKLGMLNDFLNPPSETSSTSKSKPDDRETLYSKTVKEFEPFQPLGVEEELLLGSWEYTSREMASFTEEYPLDRLRDDERIRLVTREELIQDLRNIKNVMLSSNNERITKWLRPEFRQKVIELMDENVAKLEGRGPSKAATGHAAPADSASPRQSLRKESEPTDDFSDITDGPVSDSDDSQSGAPETDTPSSYETLYTNTIAGFDKLKPLRPKEEMALQLLEESWKYLAEYVEAFTEQPGQNVESRKAMRVEVIKGIEDMRDMMLNDNGDDLHGDPAEVLRPEFRERAVAFFGDQLAAIKAAQQRFEGSKPPSQESETSSKPITVETASELDFDSENRDSASSGLDTTEFLRLYLMAKKKFYESQGWSRTGMANPPKSGEVMSDDETDVTWYLTDANLKAIDLSEFKGYGKLTKSDMERAQRKMGPALNDLRLAEAILRTETSKVRPALKDAMMLHLERIRLFLQNWAKNAQKRSITDDDGYDDLSKTVEALRGPKDATYELFAEEFEAPLLPAEKEVIESMTTSMASSHGGAWSTDPRENNILERKAHRKARMLVERARKTLRDHGSKMRPEFREKYTARVEKLAEKLDRLVDQLDRLIKLNAEVKQLEVENAKLAELKDLLQGEPVDEDQWLAEFTGAPAHDNAAPVRDWRFLSSPSPKFRLPPPKSKAPKFSDIIKDMDPNRRRLREMEEIIREKLGFFTGGVEIKLINRGPDNNAFFDLGEVQLNDIKRNLAGLFAAQMLNNNPQERLAAELEDSYNLDNGEEETAKPTGTGRAVKRILDF